MIAKFLAFYAQQFKSPVTLFEAWETKYRGGRPFWIPVQPTGSHGVGVAVNYRKTCEEFRGLFEAEAMESFKRDDKRGEHCPYKNDCPAERACLSSDKGEEHLWRRCLRFVEIREQTNPCYQSDLKVITGMIEGFRNRSVDPKTPFRDTCWAGYEEWAYPVVVHDHLVGVVMVGQFDTKQTPTSVEQFADRERLWRIHEEGNPTPQVSLRTIPPALEDALKEEPRLPPRGDAMDDLESEISDLIKLAAERYLRQRHLTESAFRDELAGTATGHLLKGDNLQEFLPEILSRMRVFWAFEDVALCIMDDAEAQFRLHATQEKAFAHPGKDIAAAALSHLAEEFGTYSVLLGGSHKGPPPEPCWIDLKNELKESITAPGRAADDLTLFVVVRVGRRVYLFCFFGRNTVLLSDLPHKQRSTSRLSREAREHITKTSEDLAGYLHHFWTRNDQEQMYRVLSHSMRSLVVTMKKGDGLLRHSLGTHKTAIQSQFPQLYEDAQLLLESLQLGAEAVDGELTSLASVASLASPSDVDHRQSTDLVEFLHRLKPVCQWRARVRSLRVGETFIERPVVWDFQLPDKAVVKGDRNVIALAVRNVLDNAFKYSYPDRTIRVEVACKGDEVTLAVTNRGVPIEQHEIRKVWHRDYRGQRVRRRDTKGEAGTGYGLFVVREIMKAVGREPTLTSKPLGQSSSEAETTITLSFFPSEDP
jgi:signal transduction histidine kinase